MIGEDPLDLDGQAAFVTGAGQGAGRAIALLLAHHNAGGIAVNDFVEERAEAVAAEIRALGVPACALYYKTTAFDLLLPRVLAGRSITRRDLARMAEGGFCLGCKACTFPKCPFGK